jgi:hypothetical protein
VIDDRRALRLAVYGHTYLGGCLYRYRKALGNRGRDDLRGLVPRTRARGRGASMSSPKLIVPYKSGLVVLFSVSLFIIFLFNSSVSLHLICSQARASGCAPRPPSSSGILLLTASVPFAATVLHHSRLASWVCRGALLIPNRCRLSQRCLLHFPSAK